MTTKTTDSPTDTEEDQSICCSRRLKGRGCYACGADPGLLCHEGGCVGCGTLTDPICSSLVGSGDVAAIREEAQRLDRVLAGLGADHELLRRAIRSRPLDSGIPEEIAAHERDSTDPRTEDSGPTDLGGSVTSVGGDQAPTDQDRRWHTLLTAVVIAQRDKHPTTQAVADRAGYSKSWADRLLRSGRSEGFVDHSWVLVDLFPAPTVRAKVWNLTQEGEEELARLSHLLS